VVIDTQLNPGISQNLKQDTPPDITRERTPRQTLKRAVRDRLDKRHRHSLLTKSNPAPPAGMQRWSAGPADSPTSGHSFRTGVEIQPPRNGAVQLTCKKLR
jgi:hypothetical protein